MAIKGKIIGGLIGCFWGPIGALVGVIVGHLIDSAEEAIEPHRAVLRALSGIAQCNGPITERERRCLEFCLRPMFAQNPPADAAKIVEEAVRSPASPKEAAELLKELPDGIKRLVLLGSLSIASADGGMDDAESAWLASYMEQSGIHAAEITPLSDLFDRRNTLRLRRLSALQTLGLNEDASEEDIRSAYRRLANDFHPDKLGHVSSAVQQLADEKMKHLNEAYRTLKGGEGAFLDELEGWSLDVNSLVEGRSFMGGQLVRCLCCSASNRLPQQDQLMNAKCGQCFALLLLPRDLARASTAGPLFPPG